MKLKSNAAFNRRRFLVGAPLAALLSLPVSSRSARGETLDNLRTAARTRGVEVGAMVQLRQLGRPGFVEMIKSNFTLAANQFDEMAWGPNVRWSDEPKYESLSEFLDFCEQNGLRPRTRNVYSHENAPRNAHLRPDGTLKNKSELEKTLLKRVEDVCRPINGRNAIIQVLDEILADHEGGIRKDPFTDAFGEQLADILFHAAHEAAPDALLTYQEFGPEANHGHFFDRKTKDYLALLERLRKRNVPITGAALGGWLKPNLGGLTLDKSFFKAVEDLEYDIHLNELTVVYQDCGGPEKWHPATDAINDSIATEHYVRAFRFLCEFKRLREITFWAPVDGDNTVQTGTLCLVPYAKARPGIFNGDLSAKPVYHALVEAVNKSRASI